MVKRDRAFEVIKILLGLLYSLPSAWADGVTNKEYTLIASYLISKDPDTYSDMVEDYEHLFDDEIMELTGYSKTEQGTWEWSN